MKNTGLLFCLLLLLNFQKQVSAQLYSMSGGEIQFVSDAKLERIEAKSTRLKGLLDLTTNQFAFSVDILTFEGFNSDLQREHFQENYLEAKEYPRSTFTGKLIDKLDPTLTGQTIRAKGILDIHGIKKERIIEVRIKKTSAGFEINSDFNVMLQDHGIEIPRVVFQKIHPFVTVKVSGTLVIK